MIDEYKAAGIAPRQRVRAVVQPRTTCSTGSRNEPAFGEQAVYLDDRVDTPGGYDAAVAGMADARGAGREDHRAADVGAGRRSTRQTASCPRRTRSRPRRAGLDIITWTLERSGLLADGRRLLLPVGHAAPSTTTATRYTMLDVLAQQVGVRGIFSDWPATVTYYANCMGL